MASGPHHFMGNRWGNSGNSVRLYFLRFQNHCRWWLQPWNWKILAPWKKVKWSEVKVVQSCPTLCDPMDCIVHGIVQARILEWVALPFSRGSCQPRDWTQVSRIAGWFFTSWATREAQEYWSLSLLQQVFLTQESNRGLLNCRWILYQLSLDSILKSRDITFPTKVCLVKAVVFPVVMYGCESWTIKKAERRRIDAFELWCWKRRESLGLQGDPTS